MHKLIFIPVALMCVVSQARAEDSGNSMIDACKEVLTQSAGSRGAYCLGQMTMLGMIWPFIDKEFEFCPPTNATPLQAVRIVVKYMDDHPSELDRRFSFIALHSLRTGWPCKK